MDQKVRAAQQAGYNQGLNDGIAQGTERIQPVLASLSGMIQEVAQLKPKYRHDAESSAVALALAVARRVLYREIATDPEAILGLVKAGFEKINARETHRLRVSPEDLAILEQHGPRIGLPTGVALLGDPKLARGSAIFETSRGDLDASMDTQLLEIDRGFADLIRRRAH
jgi:flagellar assembly protein FliH